MPSGATTAPMPSSQVSEASPAPAGVDTAAFDAFVASRCSEPSVPGEVVTNSNGDGSSGVEAIKGFNYAYFTLKDAEEAVKYLDAAMYSNVRTLQTGIDNGDNGDGYCLRVRGGEGDVFDVSVVEFAKPSVSGGEVQTWRTDQKITVKQNEGKWVIANQTVVS